MKRIFIPIYQDMTGRSNEEIFKWIENDDITLFALFFIFYSDIFLIVAKTLKNDNLIKLANEDRKSWLTEEKADFSGIYDHNFKKNSGCFVATIVFEGANTPEVKILRNFRDKILIKLFLGQKFVNWYYKIGPVLALKINSHGQFKRVVRLALNPIVWICKRMI